MKLEQQRIAIAEACGWGVFENTRSTDLLDYCNDLNAMHEAEDVMTEMQRCDYSNHLYDLARKHQEVTKKWRYLSMTAAQRAEAFLRTINKWEETTQ